MTASAFKIANRLITGEAALEQLSVELTRLNINFPLIVTDAVLVKSGTVDLTLAQLGGRRYGVFDQVKPRTGDRHRRRLHPRLPRRRL